jgi:two-component SAPR family response regulator
MCIWGGMGKVMIIDDESIDCLILTKLIEKVDDSVSVECFSSPTKAMEYLNTLYANGEAWPSHIFIDVNMPLLNGFEFIEQYLSFPTNVYTSTKHFILSSSLYWEDKKRANSYSIISEYLVKPITVEKAIKLFGE